jgi:hypothetical protein
MLFQQPRIAVSRICGAARGIQTVTPPPQLTGARCARAQRDVPDSFLSTMFPENRFTLFRIMI